MNGYYIHITNKLLEKKHIENMGSSVWLFMWLLDKMTSIDESGTGKVLGGRPITYEEVEVNLGISARTYKRWLEILRKHNYITTKRTPVGLCFTVHKAKKSWNKGYAKNGTSEVPKVSSDVPKSVQRSAKNGTSNIRQLTKTINKDSVSKIEKDYRGEPSPAKERLRAKMKAMYG